MRPRGVWCGELSCLGCGRILGVFIFICGTPCRGRGVGCFFCTCLCPSLEQTRSKRGRTGTTAEATEEPESSDKCVPELTSRGRAEAQGLARACLSLAFGFSRPEQRSPDSGYLEGHRGASARGVRGRRCAGVRRRASAVWSQGLRGRGGDGNATALSPPSARPIARIVQQQVLSGLGTSCASRAIHDRR